MKGITNLFTTSTRWDGTMHFYCLIHSQVKSGQVRSGQVSFLISFASSD